MPYWTVVGYCTVCWERTDNFAMRKVLHEEKVPLAIVHDLIVEALDRNCSVAELTADPIRAALDRCGQVADIIVDDDLGAAGKASRLGSLLRLTEEDQLRRDLEDAPIAPFGFASVDEGDEAIETAGAMAPVETLTLVGSKGLSAHHVIIIGCDDVNFGRISPLTFFVGLTRARRSLHLLVALKSGGARAAHAFLAELPQAQCEFMTYTKTDGLSTLPGRQTFERKLRGWGRFTRR
jgi:hypothetical protein